MTAPDLADYPEDEWRHRLRWSLRFHAGEDVDPSQVPPRLRPWVTGRMIDSTLRAARQAETDRGREDLEAAMARIVGSAPSTLPVRSRPSPSLWDPTLDRNTYWSPTPILGFRVWEVGKQLHGAKRPWPTPTYEAGCLRGGTELQDDQIPHTGGCRKPPCGIYATKDPDALLRYGGPERAIGLVELSGKVVEHDFGYRARRATAVFLVVGWIGGEEIASTPEDVAAVFADPQGWLESHRTAGARRRFHPVGATLREAAERHRRALGA